MTVATIKCTTGSAARRSCRAAAGAGSRHQTRTRAPTRSRSRAASAASSVVAMARATPTAAPAADLARRPTTAARQPSPSTPRLELRQSQHRTQSSIRRPTAGRRRQTPPRPQRTIEHRHHARAGRRASSHHLPRRRARLYLKRQNPARTPRRRAPLGSAVVPDACACIAARSKADVPRCMEGRAILSTRSSRRAKHRMATRSSAQAATKDPVRVVGFQRLDRVQRLR